MTQLSILLVTHLASVRAFVRAALQASDSIAIVASCTNLMEAYAEAEMRAPHVAIVSHEFSRLPEFEMLAALFKALDTRWVFVGSNRAADTGPIPSQAGGADIFPVDIADGPAALLSRLRSLVRAPQRMATAPAGIGQARSASSASRAPTDRCLVLIGSSTGGVEALSTLLGSYPADCPPTMIVQHTGESFGESLVRLLDNRCAAKVVTAQSGLTVGPGTVCVAAGKRTHLKVSPRQPFSARLEASAPVSGHVPSVDVLFRSAHPHAAHVVACLLTGMGSDGAQGLLSLRHAGARTFAQDEQTSVVYGMPRVAWEIGAAETRISIRAMSKAILDACNDIAPKTAALGR